LTRLPLGLAVALALAVAGCGGGEATTPTSPETPQALPKLSKRWQVHRDRVIGYVIGIPPHWQVSRSRQAGVKADLIRSPDHLVAVTVVAARDSEALEVPLDEFATSALAALPGFERQLVPSDPRPFRRTPLAAVQTTAIGTAKARGIRERTTLLVLRREGVVNYTVAIVENAQQRKSAKDRAVALKMMRTLRDEPVGRGRPPESQ
jgi:hypothetical protein